VCEQVVITGLKTINEIPVLNKSLAFHPGNNTDGINPDGCKNVRISRCFMHCGDDCFVVKASGASGVATEVSENISVQQCMAYSFAAGIKIGTETRCRTIRNISFDAIDMVKVGTFITISIWDWAQVSNCTISNIRCEEAHHMSLDIALRRRKEDQPSIGSCRNLVLENISIAHSQRGVLHGYDAQHQFENVVVRGVAIEGRMIDSFEGSGIERNEFFGAIDFDTGDR
jgi:polygalacturonase